MHAECEAVAIEPVASMQPRHPDFPKLLRRSPKGSSPQ